MTREQAEQLRKLLENQTANMADEQILKYPDFVEKWEVGKAYEVGKRLEHNGTIYKVLTAHTSQDAWTPPDAPSLFAKVLIPDGELKTPYIMRLSILKIKPYLFEKKAVCTPYLVGGNQTDTIPEWEQPDSTNPYAKGDKVTHNGKTWQSTTDNNVWEPGVYGWEEV